MPTETKHTPSLPDKLEVVIDRAFSYLHLPVDGASQMPEIVARHLMPEIAQALHDRYNAFPTLAAENAELRELAGTFLNRYQMWRDQDADEENGVTGYEVSQSADALKAILARKLGGKA